LTFVRRSLAAHSNTRYKSLLKKNFSTRKNFQPGEDNRQTAKMPSRSAATKGRPRRTAELDSAEQDTVAQDKCVEETQGIQKRVKKSTEKKNIEE